MLTVGGGLLPDPPVFPVAPLAPAPHPVSKVPAISIEHVVAGTHWAVFRRRIQNGSAPANRKQTARIGPEGSISPARYWDRAASADLDRDCLARAQVRLKLEASSEQTAFSGAPVHANVPVPANPESEVSCAPKVAVCPLVIVLVVSVVARIWKSLALPESVTV